MSDPQELLTLALDTARAAAGLIRRERPAGRVGASSTKSSATDAVTVVDVASERLIRERLTSARPGDGFLGEESGAVESTTGITWVVDPIDGTTNFIYGLPVYAVSIAALRADGSEHRPEPGRGGGTVVAGVVLDVVHGEEFTAVRDGGARLRRGPDGDPAPLVVVDPGAIEHALVATGFAYDPHRRAAQGAAVAALLPHVRDVRRVGAASLDLCWLAAGRVDAYVEQGLKPWDLAAGGLVAREAGAVVTGLDGEPADERLVLGCAPGLYAAFSRLVRECGF